MKMYENYIATKKLDLDLDRIKLSCYSLYDLVNIHFVNDEPAYNAQSTLSTKLFKSYNLLMYPYPQFWELHAEIKKKFIS